MIRIFLLFALTIFTGGTAKAEEGCPPGQFPSPLKAVCTPVSEYDRVVQDGEPMIFQVRQVSPFVIWIGAEGVITPDTPRQFAEFLKTDDAKLTREIEIHSPGGNLAAGLALGREIRVAGYNTSIGRSVALSGLMEVYQYKHAACMSACAYAFLGGIKRSFGKDDIYGLHRFSDPSRSIDSDGTQIVTSELAKYIEDMGVDQNVLRLSSVTDSKDILPISVEAAKRLKIIFDPDRPASFVVQMIDGEIVANSHIFFRQKYLQARIVCDEKRYPVLMLWGDRSLFPPRLMKLKNEKATLDADGSKLAALISSGYAKDGSGYFIFVVPNLSWRNFAGRGLSIDTIDNEVMHRVMPPNGDPSHLAALSKKFAWLDLVNSVSFRIRDEHPEKSIPIVLKDCHR